VRTLGERRTVQRTVSGMLTDEFGMHHEVKNEMRESRPMIGRASAAGVRGVRAITTSGSVHQVERQSHPEYVKGGHAPGREAGAASAADACTEADAAPGESVAVARDALNANRADTNRAGLTSPTRFR
jgi:hypothetical protein